MDKKELWCYYCMRKVLYEWDKVMERWVHDCPEMKQKAERKNAR